MKRSSSFWAAILALCVGLAWGPSRAADEEEKPGEAGLKALLSESGLKYKWDAENHWATISYSDIKNMDRDTIYVWLSDKGGQYVKMTVTIINKEKGFRFPDAVVRQALILARRLTIVRLSLDEKYGDIDASVGFLQEGVSPKVFKDYASSLVRAGEDAAKELKELM